jgi:hypothetical protein
VKFKMPRNSLFAVPVAWRQATELTQALRQGRKRLLP